MTADTAPAPEDIGKILLEEDRREKEKNAAVLEQLRAKVGEQAFKEIGEIIKESGHTWDYKFADKPLGQPQCEEWSFGDYYVNQTTNGGLSGDEYAGTVSIPVGDGTFFQFGYSM